MSTNKSTGVDYFDLNGDLKEEAYEFYAVKLEDYIDKRSTTARCTSISQMGPR